MKRIVFSAVVAMCAISTVKADEAKASKPQTPEEKAALIAERTARYRAITERKTGGLVRKPNSAKGSFVVVNAQKTVPEKELASIVTTLDKYVRINSSIQPASGEIGITNVKNVIKTAGGALGVALVENGEMPAFLAAPEEGWVIVNVAPLVKGVEPNVAASRVRKEVLRAYGFVAGGIYMARGAFMMREVREPSDLDAIPREMFGIDFLAHVSQSSARFGVTPWYETTYRKACTEGWAASPTNDNQKAIWDEIHAMPTAPMKILPESQKQKK